MYKHNTNDDFGITVNRDGSLGGLAAFAFTSLLIGSVGLLGRQSCVCHTLVEKILKN